jgi:hypothetical protein
MNTPKWVLSTLFIGPLKIFQQKKNLPWFDFFGHGHIITHGKNKNKIKFVL